MVYEPVKVSFVQGNSIVIPLGTNDKVEINYAFGVLDNVTTLKDEKNQILGQINVYKKRYRVVQVASKFSIGVEYNDKNALDTTDNPVEVLDTVVFIGVKDASQYS